MPFCSLYNFEGRDFAFDDTAENAGHVEAGYGSCGEAIGILDE